MQMMQVLNTVGSVALCGGNVVGVHVFAVHTGVLRRNLEDLQSLNS